MTKDLKIGIVEDEKSIRESVAYLINESEGFSCEDVFDTAEVAIKKIPKLNLDVVLMDIHLPDKTGIQCVEKLFPLCPNTQFIMFTSFEDTELVFNALKAGAKGYLTKTTQPSKILEAIIEVYNGGSPMSSNIARKVVTSFHHTEKNNELEKLTDREKQILEYLSKGLRYKEIATQLFVSAETIRTHVRNIYDKLQVNSRTEAINKAYKN